MRILRNLLLLVFPILIFINLYRFMFDTSFFEYRGFSYIHQYFSTFNGLNNTLGTLVNIQEQVSSFQEVSVEVTDLVSFGEAFVQFFQMIFAFIQLPIWVIVDIVQDLWWFITMFTR